MSGIAGYFLKDGMAFDEADLKTLGERLLHRGPDNLSFLIRDSAGFACARLSIIDVSEAGNPPFYDGRYVLCYDGQIYNYPDLKKQLIADGVRFKSNSDTEVLFHHLIRKGVKATLESIRGMFAFSFYDSATRTLYLCRDRLGIKPLNWTLTAKGLFWASEIKALVDIVPLEPDPLRTLHSLTGSGELSVGETVFKDVKQVQPGTSIKYESAKAPIIRPYFDLIDLIDQNYYRELDRSPFESVKHTFSSLLESSVKKMLRSDAPIGAFTSGGVDSSLIAAYARRHHNELGLFTSNILGPFSEYPAAELLANSIGAPLYANDFEPGGMLRDWVSTTYYNECPIVHFPNGIPFHNLAKLAREKKVKSVLTGEGGDELFLGYASTFQHHYFKWLNFPVELYKAMYGICPRIKRTLFPTPEQQLPVFISNLVQGSEVQALSQRAREAFGFLPKSKIRYSASSIVLLRRPLVGLLRRNDRMGMMASVESRFPYLDEDLVKFAVNLPCRWRFHKTGRVHDILHPFVIDKYILRKLARDILPEKIAMKKKWPFVMYEHKSIRVKKGFFIGGYLQNLLGLSEWDEEQLVSRGNPPFIARLVSVDIFGRLYGLKQKEEEINRQLHDHVSLQRAL